VGDFHLILDRFGVSRRLSRRFSWFAVLFAFFLAAPAARPQKASQQNAPAAPAASAGPAKFDQTDEANSRITELAIAAAAKQEDYVIGSGDVLAIEVFDVKELSREVRVNESGFVSLPLIPVKIQAAGLTTFQFQDKVAELLQSNGLVSHPEVSVTVKERHGEPITVAGAVKTPTVIQAVGRITLLEALSQAGGISADAGEEIVITRSAHPADPNNPSPSDEQAEPTLLNIDLNQLLDSGNPKYNIPLLGGDVVNVARAGIVYAVGAVQRAGGFVMQNDHEQMSVLKLLALSGGLTPTAKSHNAVILRRTPGSSERVQVPVDVRRILTLKSGDVLMVQNDILFVPDSVANRALRRTGEIAISLATGAALYRTTAY
jgi:polysaccharide export outer membrane protein